MRPSPGRIGIEASSTAGPRTGIGYATTELINALLTQWPAEWPPPVLWANSPRHPLPPEAERWRQAGARVSHTRWPGRLLLRSWQYLNWPAMERLTGPLALAHSPASYIPPVREARRLVTVHDLYFKYAPEHVEPYGGGYFAQTFKRLAEVERVIAISRFTRDELMRFYELPGEKISVIPQGLNHRRFSAEPAANELEMLAGLNIERPYLLCVATIEPRKNLASLLEGYARARQILQAAHQRVPRLVIAGLAGWGMKSLCERLHQSRLDDPNLVQLTGYVPDALLPVLYRQALCLIFPSLYEGFGMPVLEAMACGCPVLASDGGALPEVTGDAALSFNPRDSDALARTMAGFLADPHLRGVLRERGLERATLFSWEQTARATLDVYRGLLEVN